MRRLHFLLAFACISVGLVMHAAAQSPAELPAPADRLRNLEDRLETLERENADFKAESQRLRQMVESPAAADVGNSSEPLPAEVIVDPNQAPYPADAADGSYAPAGEMTFAEALGTHYKDGFVLVDTPDPHAVPFWLRLNLFNQVRYLNQQLDSTSFVDHLGNVHPVDSRNDINVNRNLFYFNGYVFDPNLVFSFIIWSSNSVATVIQGGYLSYKFSDEFTLFGGYYGIPGSRSNTRNFMFLQGVERSMADSFFRPGFTQAIWAEGKLFDQIYYSAYMGNSMNTLNVNTSKIDRNMVYATSAWWEPLGDYGPPGIAKMAYSDLEYHESPAVRHGTSFVGSREDRFSNAANASNPENVALYNSDGTLVFAPGSLAPGVSVQLVNAYMWAQDFGFKYRGLALNGQYYLRWLNNFRADGPLPFTQTFDHGYEASLGYFIIPQTFEMYGRSSAVFGQFRNSSEYALGFNWHPWQNRGFRVIGEANHVDKSPTASIQTTYQAGMTGWNFVLQTQLYF